MAASDVDRRQPVCLIVLDGWGISPPGPGNAIALAATPVLDELTARFAHAELDASGAAVGLPDGQMGNSEVGHLTLGAGAVVAQPLTLVGDAIAHGELSRNRVLRDALTSATRVHLIGLASDGGVHSHYEHTRALIGLAASLGTEELVLHCITDGRDTSPTAGAGFLETIEGWCEKLGAGRVASVVGRWFAMDRDNRWERTQLAYDLLVHGRSEHRADNAPAAARAAYARGETDEFIAPTLIGAEGQIRPGDSVLCTNFRPDRMRQLVRALADPTLAGPDPELPGWRGRDGIAPVAHLATLTPYREGWPYPVAFAATPPADTLAATVARAGLGQLHVAETEKYAHVTYFFNGDVEHPQAGERRVLVPSRRDVPTYDRAPQMSAREIADAFVDALERERPAFAVVNLANADMVGHTGVIDATVRAVETADECVGRIVAAVSAAGGVCLITADHGNAERMLSDDGTPQTAHTTARVPLIVTADGVTLHPRGTLADVAPTVLALLGIVAPPAMTGRSLLLATSDADARREPA